MKVIPANMITSVEASSEYNSTYAASRLIDNHPQGRWMGTGSSEKLTFNISGGISSGLGIFNTNATNISFVLRDPNRIVWEMNWEINWQSKNPSISSILNLDGVSGNCMVQWGDIDAALVLEADLVNANGETLYAGVGWGGQLLSYPDPELNMEEWLDTTSKVTQNSNESISVNRGNMLRVFDIEAIMGRDDDFHAFIYNVAKVVDLEPAVWLVTDLNNPRWLTYARFTKLPKAKHSQNIRSSVKFQLKEVV